MVNVVAAVIKDEDGKILITQRNLKKSQGGLWEFPGGKIEPNETRENAIVREIKEELDIDIEVESYLAEKIFNYPEKDIIRALKYWENQGILALDLDEQNQLTGIQMLPFPVSVPNVPKEPPVPVTETQVIALPNNRPEPFVKPECTLDDLKAFKEKDSTTELLFIVETYLRRPLSSTDLQTIYFFIETLKMSIDLIDYLFQYCIERGKKEFHYIEKVAINWAENGIKTPSEAKELNMPKLYTVL